MDSILQFLHSLYGLPGYAMAGIACLILGWLLKSQEWFPNRRIPLITLPATALINWALAAPRVPTQSVRLYIGFNLVVGLAIAALAWLFHDQWLKDIETKIPLLGSLLKSGDTTPPAPTEPPKP